MILPTPGPLAPGVRIGCDVVALSEIADSISQFGNRYLQRIFTPDELDECGGPTRVPRLAARFAAKEAAIKAFAEPASHFVLTEIEIVNIGPLPTLRLTGSVAGLAAEQGWRQTSVSLSHTDCHGAAVVAVICAEVPFRPSRG